MPALALGYAFARSSFLVMLAHRLRYAIGIFNYFIYAAVNWYLWAAVFANRHDVATWNLVQMQTYVCVNWIARSTYYSNADSLLAARINKGEIVSDLLRPGSLLLQFYGAAAGEMFFRALFLGLPVGLCLWGVFGLLPPASGFLAAAFLVSVLLAFHLFFALNFLTGLCAVLTEKLQGFLWAKFILIQFLSGLLLPLEFFPCSFRAVLEWLPFKGIAHTPLSIYLGRWDGATVLRELGWQAGWTVALLLACEWGWRAVRRRLSSLGG